MPLKNAVANGFIEYGEIIDASSIFPDVRFFLRVENDTDSCVYSNLKSCKFEGHQSKTGNGFEFFLYFKKTLVSDNRYFDIFKKYLEENIFVCAQYGITSKVEPYADNCVRVIIDFGEDVIASFENEACGIVLSLPAHEIYEAP